MQKRTLGEERLEVSAIGCGAIGLAVDRIAHARFVGLGKTPSISGERSSDHTTILSNPA